MADPKPELVPFNSDDSSARELLAFGDAAMKFMEKYTAHAQAVEEIKRQTAVITVEDREKQRAHEERMAAQESTTLSAQNTHENGLHARREITIRIIGVIVVTGVIGFVVTALLIGKVNDPTSLLSTFGLLSGFLYLLVGGKKAPPQPEA